LGFGLLTRKYALNSKQIPISQITNKTCLEFRTLLFGICLGFRIFIPNNACGNAKADKPENVVKHEGHREIIIDNNGEK